MLKQTAKGIYQSTLLLSVPELIHGYSTRQLGDMRRKENRAQFLRLMCMSNAFLLMPQQVHGAKIMIISDQNAREGADGLVQRRSLKGVALKGSREALGVVVADCVPILAVDPKAHVIGVAHAGWKGTLANIAKNLIEAMKSVGADNKQIMVSIGPHIGMCCYSVSKDRADEFVQVLGHDPRVVSQLDMRAYLDLGYANVRQLHEMGIPLDHIDAAISCTSCQADTFYSYRKDSKETFGEIMGVIGYEH